MPFAYENLGDIPLYANISHNGRYDAVLRSIIERYSEKCRHYHSFQHIVKSLNILKTFNTLASNLPTLIWAIWFHDIEQGPEHGIRSIETMRCMLKDCDFSDDFIKNIAELILYTKHPSSPETNDGKLIHDIDLHSFAESHQQCLFDGLLIKFEYPDISDVDFFKNRQVFLRKLLQDPPLFKHSAFTYLERQAQLNIEELLS